MRGLWRRLHQALEARGAFFGLSGAEQHAAKQLLDPRIGGRAIRRFPKHPLGLGEALKKDQRLGVAAAKTDRVGPAFLGGVIGIQKAIGVAAAPKVLAQCVVRFFVFGREIDRAPVRGARGLAIAEGIVNRADQRVGLSRVRIDRLGASERLKRLGKIARAALRRAEHAPRRARLRTSGERALEHRCGGFSSALLQQDLAKRLLRRDEFRIEFQRGANGALRLVEIAEPPPRQRDVAPRVFVGRAQPHSVFEAGEGAIELVEAQQHAAEIVQDVRLVGRCRERRAHRRARFFEAPQILER